MFDQVAVAAMQQRRRVGHGPSRQPTSIAIVAICTSGGTPSRAH
jgi:hypothetical protein